MSGRVLKREVEPLGDVAERAADDLGYDLGVFTIRVPDYGVHLAPAAHRLAAKLRPTLSLPWAPRPGEPLPTPWIDWTTLFDRQLQRLG